MHASVDLGENAGARPRARRGPARSALSAAVLPQRAGDEFHAPRGGLRGVCLVLVFGHRGRILQAAP